MNSFQGVSPHHQWTSSSASQAAHQPLVGPKQGAVLLKQLANSYKQPAQPPRRGLRGSQSHPNKHYAGLAGDGLAKKHYLVNCSGPPGPSPDPVLWFPGGDAECGVTEGGLSDVIKTFNFTSVSSQQQHEHIQHHRPPPLRLQHHRHAGQQRQQQQQQEQHQPERLQRQRQLKHRE